MKNTSDSPKQGHVEGVRDTSSDAPWLAAGQTVVAAACCCCFSCCSVAVTSLLVLAKLKITYKMTSLQKLLSSLSLYSVLLQYL